MSSSDPMQTHQPNSQQDPSDETPQTPQNEIQENNQIQEEEEEGECGFCLFMKAGGCREPFIQWENCVDEGEKNKEDIVEKCHSVTKALKDCMEAHPDHYGPILQAEKAAQEEASKDLEKEGIVESKESIQVEKLAI